MSRQRNSQRPRRKPRQRYEKAIASRRRQTSAPRPGAAYRQRPAQGTGNPEPFNAPEVWHEPTGNGKLKVVVEPAGRGYVHAATPDEVRQRVKELPSKFTRDLEVVQFSRMTKKRALFPCYGMQWGTAVYLYPIEASFVETYGRPPKPQQRIDAEMYGGVWKPDGKVWRLEWTEQSIKDFYLNNVLIHEIGHILDERNTSYTDRERYANWFAIEYGYRATRGRR